MLYFLPVLVCSSNASWWILGINGYIFGWIFYLAVDCGSELTFLFPALFGLRELARPVFQNPIASSSLNEFWSKRWHQLLRDNFVICTYQPLSKTFGTGFGKFTVFLLSGILHDLIFAVMFRTMIYEETLFFGLHGVLIGIEEFVSPTLNQFPKWGRIIFTHCLLYITSPILVRPFLRVGEQLF